MVFCEKRCLTNKSKPDPRALVPALTDHREHASALPRCRRRVLIANRGLCIDIGCDAAILSAMFGMKAVRFLIGNGVSRSGTIVILALWCLLSLTIGATQALCLDDGGDCSPSSAIPAGPCHDQTPDSGGVPGCGSCIDILVSVDASARCSRPDDELRAPAAAQPLAAANRRPLAPEDAVAPTALFLIGHSPLQPLLRTTVLRI